MEVEVKFSQLPSASVVDATIGSLPTHPTEWSVFSNGLAVSRDRVHLAIDSAYVTFSVSVGGRILLGIVSSFRPNQGSARLRLLPLDGGSLANLGLELLSKLLQGIRRSLMLRKLSLYTVEWGLSEPVSTGGQAHNVRFEGFLPATVPQNGKLHTQVVVTAFDRPVSSHFVADEPMHNPRTPLNVAVPSLDWRGRAVEIENLSLTPEHAHLFGSDSSDILDSRPLSASEIERRAKDLIESSALAVALRERRQGRIVARVSIFGYEPIIRRARLALVTVPLDSATDRLSVAEGVLIAVASGIGGLGLETLCLDVSGGVAEHFSSTLNRFAVHSANFDADTLAPDGSTHASDLYCLFRGTLATVLGSHVAS